MRLNDLFLETLKQYVPVATGGEPEASVEARRGDEEKTGKANGTREEAKEHRATDGASVQARRRGEDKAGVATGGDREKAKNFWAQVMLEVSDILLKHGKPMDTTSILDAIKPRLRKRAESEGYRFDAGYLGERMKMRHAHDKHLTWDGVTKTFNVRR